MPPRDCESILIWTLASAASAFEEAPSWECQLAPFNYSQIIRMEAHLPPIPFPWGWGVGVGERIDLAFLGNWHCHQTLKESCFPKPAWRGSSYPFCGPEPPGRCSLDAKLLDFMQCPSGLGSLKVGLSWKIWNICSLKKKIASDLRKMCSLTGEIRYAGGGKYLLGKETRQCVLGAREIIWRKGGQRRSSEESAATVQ